MVNIYSLLDVLSSHSEKVIQSGNDKAVAIK